MGKKIRDEDLVLNIIVNGDRGKKELGQLERTIKDTRLELDALLAEEKKMIKQNKQSSQSYTDLKTSINTKTAAIEKAQLRMTELRKTMDITKLTTKQLGSEQARLRTLLANSTPGTAEWKGYNAQLLAVKTRMKSLKDESMVTTATLNNMATRVQRFMGSILAFLTTFYAAATGIQKATDTFVSFDDKIADVQKTTGLAKDEVLELNEALKDTEVIDTRTSQENLLGLGRIAGKLGIEGKENIIGFIKAADQISVALTEDLGGDVEQSINTIGKLVDVFKVTEEFGIEQAMIKAGSLINELGANSAASEEEIVDFMSRLAGIGPTAGISMANIAGLGSTMSQLKQSAEVAGTTFVNLIPKMFGNTAKFAQIAGMEVKDFSELLDKDANEALLKVLEGVKGNNGAMSEMVSILGDMGLEGSKAKNILSVTANNIDKLRQEQLLANKAFEEGTSITTEFTIKNNNAAAQLDKSKKAVYNMWVELGERLYPMMIESNLAFSNFLNLLKVIIDFVLEYKKSIAIATAAIIGYTIAVNAAAVATKIADTATKLWNNTLKLNPIGAMVAILVAGATAMYLYSNRTKEAAKAQESLSETQKKLNKAHNKAKELTAEETKLVDKYLKVARDKSKLDSERQTAIQELNKIAPEYLGFLTMETINTDSATNAVRRYIQSKIDQKEIDELVAKSNENRDKLSGLDTNTADVTSTLSGIKKGDRSAPSRKRALNNQLAEIEANRQIILAEQEAFEAKMTEIFERQLTEKTKIAQQSEELRLELERKAAADRIREGQILLTKEQKEFRNKILLESKSLIEQEKILHKERLIEAGIAGKKREKLTEFELSILLALETKHQNNISKIETDAIVKEIAAKEAFYKKDIDLLKIKHNEELAAFTGNKEHRKILLAQQHEEERALAQTQANELVGILQTAFNSGGWEGITADSILSDEEKLALITKLDELKLKLSELGIKSDSPELPEIGASKMDIFGMTQDDWDNTHDNIKKTDQIIEGVRELALDLINVWSNYNALVAAKENARLQQFETNSKRQKKTLKNRLDSGVITQEQYNKQVTKLDDELELEKQKTALAQAKRARNVALMMAIVNTAAGISRAFADFAFPASAIVAGIVGVAGTLQTATILATPLPEVSGREDGGFIDVNRAQDGRFFRAKYDPKKRGYVDGPTVLTGEDGKREFVASNQAYNNPTIRPVLDAIDTAQRNGSISTVNLQKMLAERGVSMAGRQDGGYIQSTTDASTASQSASVASASMETLYIEMIQNQRELNRQLKRGISAKVGLLGPGGFNEAQTELEEINDNVNL